MIRILTFILTCASISTSYAGGSSVNGVAAKAKMMQGAFTAVADDPSAIFYNPAGLVQIEGSETYFSVGGIFTEQSYQNSPTGITSDSSTAEVGLSFFASSDVLDFITIGMGIYSPFAASFEFAANPAVGGVKHEASLVRLDFVPTVAFEFKDWSAGISFVGSYIDVDSNVLGLDENADGYGFSGQGGLLYRGFENARIGINYRGPMTAKLNGSGSLPEIGPDNLTTDFKFPGVLSFGASYQFTEKWLVSLNLDWEMWSSIDEIKRNYSNPILNAVGTNKLETEDSISVRLGAVYNLTERSALRGGYSYISDAISPDYVPPTLQDFNIHSFAIGYTHGLGSYSLDIGYEFEYMPERESRDVFFSGIHKKHTHSIFAGISYNF